MSSNDLDLRYLKKTIELAKLGDGHVSPNPMVGAIITKNNRIIGQGHHQVYGGAHAEINAITDAKQKGISDFSNCILYCSLEPCCHTNKQTPPCTQTIIQENFKRVIVAALDPNPQVAGKGIGQLQKAGIECICELLVAEEAKLNERYRHHVKTKLPFVHLKIAQSLDGQSALHGGQSKWITNEKMRMIGHDLRGRYDAICVGRKTAEFDNPKLNVRYDLEHRYKDPQRIVIGSLDLLTHELHLFSDENKSLTTIFTSEKCDRELMKNLSDNGVEIKLLDHLADDSLNLHTMLQELGSWKVNSLIVEGGPFLHAQFLRQNLVQKCSFFIALKILGKGQSSIGELNFTSVDQAIHLHDIEREFHDNQLLIEGYL